MQAQSVRTLRTGIITEPGAAHLDHYLASMASCQGIGPLAYADPTGETLGQARRLLGPIVSYTSPARMIAAVTSWRRLDAHLVRLAGL